MKFQLRKIYNGFRLVTERQIKEIDSTGRLFFHERSGARLCYLENDDDNKVFAISFRTPPVDSTGMPHILEHSVLCGSAKFPSKEPFVELAKGSLHTFLNALTFPDKTMYPVASKNEKDLFNLMDVYLDAVFHPNIYKFPQIFMQEGWHYELDSVEGEINYKGVVYNEMRGAFSTPEEILFRKIHQSLFPDTAYGFESGGDPDVIPKLTYEEFLSFHKRYYHPSNSYIFLYGNGDVSQELQFLDENYLNSFERTLVDSKIVFQKPFSSPREALFEYPISPDEEEKEKTFFSLNYVIDRSTNPETYMAFTILEHMLLETPAAPLKEALLKTNVGKDVFGIFDRSILQPTFSIVVKSSNANKKGEFQDVVFKTLKRLTEKGIDKRLIEASINIHEFRLREADYRGFPKGLVYCIQIMDSWLYDEDPFAHLAYEPVLEGVKRALDTDHFEKLIDRYLLKNTHSSLIILSPKKGLEEEKVKAIKRELTQYKAELSEEGMKGLVKETMELKKRQAMPDSQQALEAIPLLSLKDIKREAEKLPLEEREEECIKVLTHHMFTSKIAYLGLLFDTTKVTQNDLPYLSLLTQIMGRVSTARYHYSDLSNEINIHTGGIGFGTEIYGNKESDSIYFPKIMVKSKALIKKIPKLFELLGEIIGHTRFDEEKRLLEIIQETKSRMEMMIFEAGHIFAARRLFSYFSPIGKYIELLSGLSFYKFIADLERNFNKKRAEIVSTLQRITGLVFDRKNLLVSITEAEDDYKSFKGQFPSILEHLGDNELEKKSYEYDFSLKNEGLLTPGKVQYVAKGYNFKHLGYAYTGSLEVLRTIASLDYLWNRIRVQGGAYGSFASFSRNGNMYFCSYRDPGLKETLDIYDKAYTFLSSYDPDEREMTKYIIGTIGKLDSPLTPSMKGEIATANYISDITQEDIQKKRDEVLSTGKDAIRRCADLIHEVMKRNYICVIGSEGKIKENKDIFTRLVPVFK